MMSVRFVMTKSFSAYIFQRWTKKSLPAVLSDFGDALHFTTYLSCSVAGKLLIHLFSGDKKAHKQLTKHNQNKT